MTDQFVTRFGEKVKLGKTTTNKDVREGSKWAVTASFFSGLLVTAIDLMIISTLVSSYLHNRLGADLEHTPYISLFLLLFLNSFLTKKMFEAIWGIRVKESVLGPRRIITPARVLISKRFALIPMLSILLSKAFVLFALFQAEVLSLGL